MGTPALKKPEWYCEKQAGSPFAWRLPSPKRTAKQEGKPIHAENPAVPSGRAHRSVSDPPRIRSAWRTMGGTGGSGRGRRLLAAQFVRRSLRAGEGELCREARQ